MDRFNHTRLKKIFFGIATICFGIILGGIILTLSSRKLDSNSYDGLQRYTVIDNLYDSEQFYDFRQAAYNINCIKDFYNQLNQERDIKVLSIFDQPIPIRDFKGSDEFYYNSKEFLENNPNVDITIKSIQINETAFCYYDLKTENGTNVNWDSINYEDNQIPVFLGAEYKDIYNIGDVLAGNFYSRDFEFYIVDFLEKNSLIYYGNDPEFCIDNYVIIPYPSQMWEVTFDYSFESILYFAMINCDIVTGKNEKDFIQIIKKVSDNSKFIDFSVIKMDEDIVLNCND